MNKIGMMVALSLFGIGANAQSLGNIAPAEMRTTWTTPRAANEAEQVLAEAKHLVALTGPGYSNHVIKKPLNDAIAAFEKSQQTPSDVATLQAAIDTFYTESLKSSYDSYTDGHIYGLYQNTLDGKTKYLCIENGKALWVPEESKMTKFYSGYTRKEGSYNDYPYFMTPDGKFLQLTKTGGADEEAVLSLSDQYNDNCQIGFSARWRFLDRLPEKKYPCEDKQLLGYLPAVWQKGINFGDDNWITLDKDNKMHIRANAVLNETESAAFWIKEFGRHNNVAHLLQDDVYYGTFSTGIATSMENGQQLYYVSEYTGNSVKLTEFPYTEVDHWGDIIHSYKLPAHTGVIVKVSGILSESLETCEYAVKPLLDQSQALPIKGNMLKSTADKAVTLPAETNAYILGKDQTTGKLTFFRLSDTDRTIPPYHAYLVLPDHEGSELLKVIWDTPTGIDTVHPEQAAEEAPIYDLSGRQVGSAQKHGIYIQNGKKFIVK